MAAEVALMPIEVRLMSDEATLIFVGVVIAVLSTIGVEAVMLSSIGARIEVRFENPRKMLRNVLNSMLGSCLRFSSHESYLKYDPISSLDCSRNSPLSPFLIAAKENVEQTSGTVFMRDLKVPLVT